MRLETEEDFRKLGGTNSPAAAVNPGAVMRYVSGCIHRERERLSDILKRAGVPDKYAREILDDSKDELVFRWKGPEIKLNDPIVPTGQ